MSDGSPEKETPARGVDLARVALRAAREQARARGVFAEAAGGVRFSLINPHVARRIDHRPRLMAAECLPNGLSIGNVEQGAVEEHRVQAANVADVSKCLAQRAGSARNEQRLSS